MDSKKLLDDDKIEVQSNAVRSVISELLNVSLYSLKEAYESQRKLQMKLNELDSLLKPILESMDPPDFSDGIQQINKLKNRIQSISNRITNLDKRLNDIDLALNQTYDE